ncbi:hypothetical protein KC218_23350, partial [Mycobacterium tuberculosis]|nr:hypothetical protein [Mycobacterium tuberculosis]
AVACNLRHKGSGFFGARLFDKTGEVSDIEDQDGRSQALGARAPGTNALLSAVGNKMCERLSRLIQGVCACVDFILCP